MQERTARFQEAVEGLQALGQHDLSLTQLQLFCLVVVAQVLVDQPGQTLAVPLEG